MSLTYTYATLKTAIKNHTEDQGTEFDTNFDDILGKAELMLLRDLEMEQFNSTVTGNFTANSGLVDKPSGLIAIQSFAYFTAGSYTPLEEKSYEYCKDYWPVLTNTTAAPKYYCEYSESQWLVVGTPNSTLSYEVRVLVRPTGLSGSNTTTWLSTRIPDCLFFACMVYAERYLKADERSKDWRGVYKEALDKAKDELARTKYNTYMPMTAIPTKEKEDA